MIKRFRRVHFEWINKNPQFQYMSLISRHTLSLIVEMHSWIFQLPLMTLIFAQSSFLFIQSTVIL